MKTKLLFLVGLPIILIFLLIVPFSTESNNIPLKLDKGMYKASFVKCIVPNFLLGEIDTTHQIAPLFENLGTHQFEISTKKPEAQIFFDQGLKLTYAFNHAEAHRSFMETTRQDTNAAMGFWGQAYALGPNINDPFPDEERRQKAWEVLQRAKKHMKDVSFLEQALITALDARYSHDLNLDLQELNIAYMMAMEKVAKTYNNNADVQTLYAAAVMNTMPWNYWDNAGNPLLNTLKAKAALEHAIKLNPDHPGAHHYYIHMVELPNPDLAVPSAEQLGGLMPAAGHLVHMPSHIFIRVGRYKDAIKSNEEAILADEDYLSQCFSQGMYPLGYYPHNIHFLWSAASFIGESNKAIVAAKKTAEKVPISELNTLHFLQDFASTPLLAYTRFGKWNDILTFPYPGDEYKHLKLIWHYSRGIAFLRKNNKKEAQEELYAIQQILNDPDLENIIANYTNPSSEIAKVAYHVVSGEIERASKNYEKAIEHLYKAVAFEDELIYSEPAPWHIPVRHTLGAVLMETKQYEEAEDIYRADLNKIRQNGWSLMGLFNSLTAQDKKDEAAHVKKQFDNVWSNADIQIDNSIL